MPTTPLTRRRFLIAAGAGLGATVLAGSGLAMVGSREPNVDMPEMTIGGNEMSDKILVAYASQAGSTAGVAEMIGRTLAESGAQVDVRRVQDVADVTPYRAVVAGSAIHGGKWLPEGMQFVQKHQGALRQKPFAAFLVCITLSMGDADKYRAGLAEWMKPVRDLTRPLSEGFFAGALDFSKLPVTPNTLLMHLPVVFGAWKVGDHRDWSAIRAWATGLMPLFAV